MDRHALIVGVTGIQGRALADRLVRLGWLVTGLARRPTDIPSGVQPVAADLLDAQSLADAVRDVQPTHVFFTAWLRQATEAENIATNGAMLRNLLAALEDQHSVRHVALTTGLKHYLGPFEAYAKIKPDTPFREDQARLDYPNFYYEQEDILFDSARRNGFTWSVHRPHTVIGFAIGNAMNMGVTLAVYATICRVTGRPFVFPGSPEQYGAVTDVTDARILASQLEWAALTDSAANQALNIVNGDVFRWRRMWGLVAEMLGVAPADYPGHPTPLVEQMRDAGPLWDDIVRRFGLRPLPLETLASWWHTDADLGRTIETLTDMSRSRRLGFLEYQETPHSFRDLFNRLRTERIIPDKDSN
ncbi:MAG TPA: SDR family oxidoreductase [Chloroflexota bacterium]|nr:SDR family oxidoreductase [Chloroflexota bacterium]